MVPGSSDLSQQLGRSLGQSHPDRRLICMIFAVLCIMGPGNTVTLGSERSRPVFGHTGPGEQKQNSGDERTHEGRGMAKGESQSQYFTCKYWQGCRMG